MRKVFYMKPPKIEYVAQCYFPTKDDVQVTTGFEIIDPPIFAHNKDDAKKIVEKITSMFGEMNIKIYEKEILPHV